MAWPFWFGGDYALSQNPGFSWDYFEDGSKLIEHYEAYDYDDHHAPIVEMTTLDQHSWGTEAFLLTLQYGRVEDARHMMVHNHLATWQRFTENKASSSYMVDMWLTLSISPQIQHLLGLFAMRPKVVCFSWFNV